MSKNPIELLQQQVTPQVVNQHQLEVDADKKASLLSQFYPILLSVLYKHPNRLKSTPHAEPHVNNLNLLFVSEQDHIKNLLQSFAKHHSLPENTIASLFNHAIPLSVQALKNEAGGEDKVVPYLSGYIDKIATQFPAWAAGLLPILGLDTLFSKSDTSHHIYQKKDEKPGILRKVFPLAAIAVLALIIFFSLRSCEKVAPVTTEVPKPMGASEPTLGTSEADQKKEPSSLTLVSGTGDAIQACHSNVGNNALPTQIKNAIAKVFNQNAKCEILTDKVYAETLPGIEKLEPILTEIKNVPNASIEWKGDQIIVNAPDKNTAQKLVDQIKSYVPELKVSAAEPLNVEQSVSNSITESKQALALLGEDATPQAIARALNIQIINFPTASRDIPPRNKEILDAAATLIKNVPNVKLIAEGYTDSSGNADANKKLSQRRAQSVVDYLVSQGVKREKLQAVGYGAENPIADNVTDQGKFRNRRIEFKVIDTTTGDTAVVNEDHAQTTTAQESVSKNP